MDNQLLLHDVVPYFYVDPSYYYYTPACNQMEQMEMRTVIQGDKYDDLIKIVWQREFNRLFAQMPSQSIAKWNFYQVGSSTVNPHRHHCYQLRDWAKVRFSQVLALFKVISTYRTALVILLFSCNLFLFILSFLLTKAVSDKSSDQIHVLHVIIMPIPNCQLRKVWKRLDLNAGHGALRSRNLFAQSTRGGKLEFNELGLMTIGQIIKIGNIYATMYGQKCQKCIDERCHFELAMWYPEEVTKV